MTHAPAASGLSLALEAVLLTAAVSYPVAAASPGWPARRTACWLLGVTAVAGGFVIPAVVGAGPDGGTNTSGSAGAVHGAGPVYGDLRADVAGHLLLGMVAPLLLVSAAPVTLALRTLPRRRSRALGRLLRSWPFAVVTHPAVAALLDTGGLWLLYRTDLLADLPASLVHAHMLLAGYLFAFSLIGPDPAPHRPGLGVRAGALLTAVAAHDVLAKLVYADPRVGVPAAQAEAAGQLLHYGALPVHLALMVLLGRRWAATRERARRRAGSRRTPGVFAEFAPLSQKGLPL